MAPKRPTLLFVTSPESGQANCHLAVIASLPARHGNGVEIHLASYPALAKRTPAAVQFHPIDGVSMTDGLYTVAGGDADKVFKFVESTPGMYGSMLQVTRTTSFIHSETPEEYVHAAKDTERIIAAVDPDYIVVDSIMASARDGIRKSGKPSTMLTPNTAKESALGDQGLSMFALPTIASAYPYPLPWYLYPANIFINIFTIVWLFMIDKQFKRIMKARKEAGYSGIIPLFDKPSERSVICMSTVGAEIPLKIPSWLKCCGPIVQVSPAFQDIDPILCQWVQGRPTVLISLSTNLKYSEHHAKEMLRAVRVVLGIRPDIQVLWKLAKIGDYTIQLDGDVKDRLRIVDWLEAAPSAILKTGNIVCFVSHGGSNSYHEALQAGVPQVVMPAWVDCYDFTARLAYLGIGEWGNPKSAPGCSEPELTKALLKVIGRTPSDSAATKMRKRAEELSNVVTKNHTVEGRDVAAAHIWDQVQKAIEEKTMV